MRLSDVAPAARMRGPERFILEGPACIESSFLDFGTGPGSGRSKRLIFKGRACTESSFLCFGTGPGFGEVVASRRRVTGIAGQGVVWVALCL